MYCDDETPCPDEEVCYDSKCGVMNCEYNKDAQEMQCEFAYFDYVKQVWYSYNETVIHNKSY